ncbi:MAG: signal peptidase I [Candidatus Symbiothrix sp.]|nr:signal peptidase I [Candidatus Symbiothrix sp.]
MKSVKSILIAVLKNCLWGLFTLVLSIVFAILLRVFCLASFKIPSYSMLPTLDAGDFIMVNKWTYGARIFNDYFNFPDSGQVEMQRLWGYSHIKRNDVVVFNFPYFDDWTNLGMNIDVFYVKRCVALAGDTFYIENGIYKVKNCPDTLGCYENQIANRQRFRYDRSRTPDECFPYDSTYHWTVLNFGPFYVPRQGDRLNINVDNIKLYRNLIAYETGQKIHTQSDTVYLGKQILQQYVFQKNYYFMAGDYVFDSRDSRYWGLLPEEHIVGKAVCIWKSTDINTGKYRWKRFFKKL